MKTVGFLFVFSLIAVVGLFIALAAPPLPTVDIPPRPPTAPLADEGNQVCSETYGWYYRTYDTDPGGPGVYSEIGVYYVGSKALGTPFLVVTIGRNGQFRAYLRSPTDGPTLTFESAAAMYSVVPDPCQLVKKMVGREV